MIRRKALAAWQWVVVLACVAAAGAAGFAVYRYIQPAVDVTEVVQAPVVEAFYATGTVSAEREYDIRAATAGIVRVSVDKGSAVKAGDVLAVVENSDLRYAVDQAKAELRRKQRLDDDATSPVLQELRDRQQAATDMLNVALDDQKRLESLRGQGGSSQTDLDTAIDRVKTHWSDVESFKSQIRSRRIDLDRDVEVAKAALDSAQWDLDQATIRSPIDGTVLDRPVSSGTRAAPNEHILQMADVTPGHLVMRAQVDEEDKNKLIPPVPGRPAQVVKMTLYAYPGEVLSGSLEKIYDKADPDRRTYEVDVRFDHPDPRLAAGMTGELNFIVQQRASALVVPTQAIQGGAVLAVTAGRLRKPNVVFGLRSIERTEVISGLNPGDVVVISPAAGLKPGTAVRTHYIDPIIAGNINKPTENENSFRGFNP